MHRLIACACAGSFGRVCLAVPKVAASDTSDCIGTHSNKGWMRFTSCLCPAVSLSKLHALDCCRAYSAVSHRALALPNLAPTAVNAWDTSTPEPLSVYVHLPFCKRKCAYCDFPVLALGREHDGELETNRIRQRIQDYVTRICSEIQLHERLNSRSLKTIYFGGGTPSLVPLHMLKSIVDTLVQKFGLDAEAEVTLEADPGTFDLDKIYGLQDLGVTRFSVGIQSFDDDMLLKCGRSHDAREVEHAISIMARAAPRSWNLDLISGLPGLDAKRWRSTLGRVIAAAPAHISVYDLQVEKRTPFGRAHRKGQLPLPSEGEAADMYALASHLLRGEGYEHYEVSSYARPGCRSAHNQAYWLGQSYYAFGLGAASFLKGVRFSRPRGLHGWQRYVDSIRDASGIGKGYWAGQGSEPLSWHDRMLESIMLLLRTSDGLSLPWLAATFGVDKVSSVLRSVQGSGDAGLLDIRCTSGELVRVGCLLNALENGWLSAHPGATLRLRDPSGFLLSNDIISDIFAAL